MIRNITIIVCLGVAGFVLFLFGNTTSVVEIQSFLPLGITEDGTLSASQSLLFKTWFIIGLMVLLSFCSGFYARNDVWVRPSAIVLLATLGLGFGTPDLAITSNIFSDFGLEIKVGLLAALVGYMARGPHLMAIGFLTGYLMVSLILISSQDAKLQLIALSIGLFAIDQIVRAFMASRAAKLKTLERQKAFSEAVPAKIEPIQSQGAAKVVENTNAEYAPQAVEDNRSEIDDGKHSVS